MPKPLRLLPPGVLALLVASCNQGGFTGDHPTGTGPFDSRGNYVEEWADNPSKWNGRSVPEPATQPATELASNNPPPQIQASPQPTTQVVRQTTPKPAPRPAPRPVVKPKPQPSVVYHTVRSGDTLYGLAKRYGTTVGKIQQANGISGSLIRPGQRLKIPKR